jgi:hypothetical protein
VRLLVGLVPAQTLVAGAVNVPIVIMALELFHAGDAGVGYLNSAVGLGGVLGGVAALGVATKRLAPSFAAGLVLWGLPLVLIAPLPYQVVAIVTGHAGSLEQADAVIAARLPQARQALASV